MLSWPKLICIGACLLKKTIELTPQVGSDIPWFVAGAAWHRRRIRFLLPVQQENLSR
ncbi:hypothetical protein Z949_1507 [Sulfitobacter guttiformis KCTC 32187]|nr:hypothetical protein Z949_1507 [Sulfitobacter guttiformis KCTC 32187]